MAPVRHACCIALTVAAAADAKMTRSADGVPIRFEVSGQGSPSLVFVHGWAFDRRLWDDQVRRLSPKHRIITLDLAGHGESGRQRAQWTMAAFGDDVKAVVEAADARQVVLIGHSMGGPVVLEAARQMPARTTGIVLVDTLFDVAQQVPPDQIDAMTKRLETDYAGTIRQFVTEYLFAPDTPASVREQVLNHAIAIPADVSTAMLRESWVYDPLPALRDIKTPIRAVNSDKFPTNGEANRRYMPGFEAIILRGTGHYPMLEDPDRFSRALVQALADVSR